MMAHGVLQPALMEADVGTAKYEHVYRSVVWRIPRLPVRNQGNFNSAKYYTSIKWSDYCNLFNSSKVMQILSTS